MKEFRLFHENFLYIILSLINLTGQNLENISNSLFLTGVNKNTKKYSLTLHISFKNKTTMKFTIFISVPFALPC
jgi:hypothetical protein